MRRIKRFIAFGFVFVFSFALLMIAMPYVMKVAVKSSASASDLEVGKISYYKADLFDYEPSKRSVNGNFLLGNTEFMTDAAFIFFNLDDSVDPGLFGRVSIPNPSEHNLWVPSYKHKVAQGIMDRELTLAGAVNLANNRIAVSGTNGVKLFENTDSRTYKGSYSFPFVNIGDGYLQYDSSENHVQVTNEVGRDGLLKMNRVDGATEYGYMPFNKINTSLGENENGYYALSDDKNFFFGTRFEIPFSKTKEGTVITGDGHEKDMMFKFAGDGELWVYVDGMLVLDLGGIHEGVEGEINFTTGVVATTGNHLDERTHRYNTEVSTMIVEDTFVKSLSVGRHKLQVYYLERGGSSSGCNISFRLLEDMTPEDVTEDNREFVGPITSEDDI